MDLKNNTVLVTGGASGIGLALAVRFQAAGSSVIICGRRADKLAEAKAAHPALHTHVADVSTAAGRQDLVNWAVRDFPSLNVIVNNAGIQRRVKLAENEPWEETHQELAANLEAPIHLSRLFIPHLRTPAARRHHERDVRFVVRAQGGRAGLLRDEGRAPLLHPVAPLSVEGHAHPGDRIIPPAVDTDLGGPGLHTFGVNVNDFADDVMAKIAAGSVEGRARLRGTIKPRLTRRARCDVSAE
jgi:uncharacterized oxidoreductase